MTFTSEQRKTAFRSGAFALDTDSEQAQGLALWLPLGVDGGKSKDWDYSLFNNHGTRTNGPTRKVVNHPRWGGVGALELDGANEYDAIGVPPLTAQDNWTLSCSILVTSTATLRRIAFFMGDANTDGYGIASSGNTAGRISVLYGNTSWNDTSTSYVENEWTDVLATRRAGTLFIYKNGVEIANSVTTTPITPTTTSFVGWDNGNSKHIGQLKDARAYNRAQSPDMAYQIANEPWRIVYPLGVRSISFAPAAVGGATPKGVFSNPFAGPFAGPIGGAI